MNLQTSMHEWDFDFDLWCAVINHAAKELGNQYLADLCGLDVSTINNWSNASATHNNKWPSMKSLMTVCNTLDVDPRQFFCLKE